MTSADRLNRSVASFYEANGPAFARTRRGPWGMMQLILDRLKPGNVLLDVGAGNGRLARYLPKDIRYVAIEPSSSLCDETRSFLTERGEGEVRQGDLSNIPAKDGEADLVTCLAVLHHVPNLEGREQALRELHRILKPGGTLILTVWNLRSWKFFSWRNWLAAWLRFPLVRGGWGGDVWVPWKAEGAMTERYVHAFTLHGLYELFDEGWEVELCVPWRDEAPDSVLQAVNLTVIAHKK